jgi:peptidyl-prolyl cis-trans isomerase D
MAMVISKFHKIIQSKIVWGAFAVIISIAFVSITAPGSKSRNAQRMMQRRAQLAGRLFGEEVSRDEFNHAYRAVVVSYILATGRPVTIDEKTAEVFRHMAWQRIAILKKAEQLGLTVAPEQIVDAIRHHPLFKNQQTGQFDKRVYDTFVSSFLSRYMMSAKDLENLFGEQVLIEKMALIPAQGALVQDEELRRMFHLYMDTFTVDYAEIPRKLAPTSKISKEDAEAFFQAHKEDFRKPERVMVRYVEFPVADHLDEVTISDDLISAYYEKNKKQFTKPAEDSSEEASIKPLEEVKDEILQLLKMAKARQIAADKADDLVVALANESVTFDQAAEKEGVKIVTGTPPFAATDSVRGVDPSAPFQRAAFALENDASHYYSDPVIGRDFVYVIALIKRQPSFLPSFDVVKEEVFAAAQLAADEEAYLKKSEEIQKAVKAAVDAGSSFSDALAKYDLKPTTTKPFQLTSPLEDPVEKQLAQMAVRYEQGKVTDLVPSTAGNLLAYVQKREPADEATKLLAMRDQLMRNLVQNKESLLVATWREDLLKEAQFEDLMDRPKDEEGGQS